MSAVGLRDGVVKESLMVGDVMLLGGQSWKCCDVKVTEWRLSDGALPTLEPYATTLRFTLDDLRKLVSAGLAKITRQETREVRV